MNNGLVKLLYLYLLGNRCDFFSIFVNDNSRHTSLANSQAFHQEDGGVFLRGIR